MEKQAWRPTRPRLVDGSEKENSWRRTLAKPSPGRVSRQQIENGRAGRRLHGLWMLMLVLCCAGCCFSCSSCCSTLPPRSPLLPGSLPLSYVLSRSLHPHSDARVPPGPSLPSLSQVLAHAPEAPRPLLCTPHAAADASAPCWLTIVPMLATDEGMGRGSATRGSLFPAAASLHRSVQWAQTSRLEARRVVSCISPTGNRPIPMRETAW